MACRAEQSLELPGYGRIERTLGLGSRHESAHSVRARRVVDDMRNEQRWPDYAQNVVAHGVLSSLSVPLPFQGVTIGALNTYGGRPRVVDDSDLELAEEVAAWVAIAVGNAEAAARTSEDLTQLRTAMMSRALIEQAKGVLMERHKITEDEAFTMLTHASQRTKKSLRDVAQSLSEPARSPVETDADPARFHHLLAHTTTGNFARWVPVTAESPAAWRQPTSIQRSVE